MKVLVLGKGLSGKSACEFLLKKGYVAEIVDDKYLDENYEDFDNLDRLLSGLSFIVVSPGLSLDLPIIKHAKKKNIKVVGELELGAKNLASDIIAITGTNGKTTTTSLVGFLLSGIHGKKVFVGGNIGVPVTSFCERAKKQDMCVLECSSFQLETVQDFKPKISAILNISPDHLNRHKTMKKYISAKYNITKNQDENDYLILNADSKLLVTNKPNTRAQIYYFSTRKKVKGCYLKKGCIYFNDGITSEKLASLENIKLVGEHNLSNILCASLAVYLLTKNKSLLQKINEFLPVEHRLEYVKTIHGVDFFNDSKATNIDSTIVALKSFTSPINLILGGSDKGYDFDKLFANFPQNVENIAIFGQTKQKILISAKKYNFKNLHICSSLKDCVMICFSVASPGQIVLLSPACASFDHFKNFEERGNVFKKIVQEIAEYEATYFSPNKKT